MAAIGYVPDGSILFNAGNQIFKTKFKRTGVIGVKSSKSTQCFDFISIKILFIEAGQVNEFF